MRIIQNRRDLHRIPELNNKLPKTLSYLRRELEGLGCRVSSPTGSSLCAFFDFGAGSALAFRADMDGLPIWEKSGCPFASIHPGKMHACGHDGHMAIALELARRLSAKKENPNDIALIFQPAEETSGGALDICRSGIFQKYRVRAVFGLHIWPGLPAGEIFTRPGVLMARSCPVELEVFGRSGHITEACADALAAATGFYRQARQIGQGLVRFGLLQAGTAGNVTAGKARLSGTLRAWDGSQQAKRALFSIAQAVEAATGCALVLQLGRGYPAVENSRWLVEKVRQRAAVQLLPEPVLLSEDFSYYQRQVPGVYFFLGAGNGPALHRADFDFPEKILEKGAKLWEILAQLG